MKGEGGSLVHVRIAAVVAAAAVGLGAFGAHGLEERFVEVGEKAAGWWDTAVFYHLVHAVALFALAASSWFVKGPWWLLLVGTFLFSGSLYVMGVTGFTKLGMVTPLGGLSFIAGWIGIAWKAGSRRGGA